MTAMIKCNVLSGASMNFRGGIIPYAKPAARVHQLKLVFCRKFALYKC